MSRILVASEESWYDELNAIASYYETEFERTIKQQVIAVFPDYYTSSFKLEIYADQKEAKKPDLAMVHREYRDWWIVEVELGGHDFTHVFEQVSVFTQGIYNSIRIAEYIKAKNIEENNVELDLEKLKTIIREQQPKVLVIVDEPRSEWEEELKRLGVSICVFQVYRNTVGGESYRLDGDYPECYYGESHCRYHQSKPNVLEILMPTLLGVEEGEEVLLFFNNKSTRWKRIDDGEMVYLQFAGVVNPIPTNRSYVISKDAHDRLILRVN